MLSQPAPESGGQLSPTRKKSGPGTFFARAHDAGFVQTPGKRAARQPILRRASLPSRVQKEKQEKGGVAAKAVHAAAAAATTASSDPPERTAGWPLFSLVSCATHLPLPATVAALPPSLYGRRRGHCRGDNICSHFVRTVPVYEALHSRQLAR